jgi:hypothetical protein
MADPAVRTAAIRLRRIAGIPADKFTALGDVYGDALEMLQKAKSTDRTVTITAQCQAAFKAMTDAMADFKRRFFLCPPLTEADLTSLGLRPRKQSSPTGKPTAQVKADLDLAGGRHQLAVEIVYISGSPDDRENKGYRLWYSLVAPGETPPGDPDDLRKSWYTKRKRDVVSFEYRDSGKTVYMAVQVENDGIKGDWGPIVSALIP